MRGAGDAFRPVATLPASAGAFFDTSDPECPVAIRRCRNCGVELRYSFPGGVRPRLLAFIRDPACESCGAEEDAALERAELERTVGKRVRQSGIPPALFEVATWDELLEDGETPTDTSHRRLAIEKSREWAEGARKHGTGVLIYGPAGSGKTRLAATIARAALERMDVTWVSVGVLMAQLQGSWNDDERRDALKVLTAKGAIVLDDFDKVNHSSALVRSQLFAALEQREAANAPVIVTTNHGLDEISKRLGDAIASRLAGRSMILHYPGPDRRLAFKA